MVQDFSQETKPKLTVCVSISHSYHQLLYLCHSIPQHERNKMLCWLPSLSTIIIAIIITNSTFTSFCFQTITFTSVESIPHMDPVVYLYYRPIKTKNLFFFCQMISPKLPLRITGMNIAIIY